MTLSIIIIGDEILLGQVADTNSRFISSWLGRRGWRTHRVLTVGDNASDIRRAVEMCMADSDLTVTTGGLGPTKDDITKNVLAGMFGCGMRFDKDVERDVTAMFARRGLQVNELTRLQAMVPEACEVVRNSFGTAPLMWFERVDGEGTARVLLSMPGVPYETEGMLAGAAGEKIAARFTADRCFFHTTLLVTGITESALAERLDEFETSLPAGFHLAYLPAAGVIRLRLDGECALSDATEAGETNRRLVEELKGDLGPLVVADRDMPLAEVLIGALRRRGLTMATAESCTGGNIARTITSVAGCSDVFVGSVVSYSNEVKMTVLGVDAEVIASCGAVSRPTVEAMARGVCRITGAACSVAVSGIAGPSGATADKPVGTVWFAVNVGGQVSSGEAHFPGNRGRVIERATNHALAMLLKAVEKEAPDA